MRTLIFFSLFALSVAISDVTKEGLFKQMLQIIGTCTAKTGATGADMQEFVEEKTPTSKTGKCFIACMYKETNFMTPEGKLDVAGAMKFIEALKDEDPDMYGKIETVTKNCVEKVTIDPDECETAANLFTCFKAESKEIGLDTVLERK